MKAYYFVFFIMSLISLFYQAKGDKQWRWKLFWTFLPLFIYAAIRVDYGNDYPGYEEFYYSMQDQPFFQFDHDHHVEIGYQLLNRIMPSFRLLLVFNSLLLCLALGVFCYHNVPRKYFWLIIVLIFLNPEKNIFGNLVGIRNGLVVTSFLLGFVFIQKRQWIKFAILTIGLSFIHTSALLFLPVAYIAGMDIQFKPKEIIIWVGAAAFLLLFSMTQLFDVVAAVVDVDAFNRYEGYLEQEIHRGYLASIANVSFMVFFIIYLYKRGDVLKPETNSLLRVGMLYCVASLMGSLAMRASYFYDMFFLSSVVTVFSDKKAPNWLRVCIVVLAIAVSYYSMFIVWMQGDWWGHGTYHSLLGDW